VGLRAEWKYSDETPADLTACALCSLRLGHAHSPSPSLARGFLDASSQEDVDPQELFSQMQEMEAQHAAQIAALEEQLRLGGAGRQLGDRWEMIRDS